MQINLYFEEKNIEKCLFSSSVITHDSRVLFFLFELPFHSLQGSVSTSVCNITTTVRRLPVSPFC